MTDDIIIDGCDESYNFVLGEDILTFIYRDIEKDFAFFRNKIKKCYEMVAESLPRSEISLDIRNILIAISDNHSVINGDLGTPLYLLLYRDIMNSPDTPILKIIENKELEYIEAANRLQYLADKLYKWQESNKIE
jgi:hypothetical protein